MFTLIRMGKDRKDKDKEWTLCYIYIMFYIVWDIRKIEERLYIFFMVPIINISTTYFHLDKVQIQQSHCLLVPVVFIEQFPFLFSFECSLPFSLCNIKSYKFLLSIRLYWHHTTTILFYCHLLFSSWGNSESWSWHQICDASFFYFTLIVL